MAGLGLAFAGCSNQESAQPSASLNALVRADNALAGTSDWLLKVAKASNRVRCPWVEGFCSSSSVLVGSDLTFYVSTQPESQFTVDVYRMGYYGGKGARHMKSTGPVRGIAQPDPVVGPRRVRECTWEPSFRLTIPDNWLSGIYLAKLTAVPSGIENYVIFIVRDERKADFVFQCSDTTWQAYNRWPRRYSLYDSDKKKWYWGPNVQVSFDRPYGRHAWFFRAPLSAGTGEWLLWEFPLAYWLEEQGYDVTYISNLDTHADPECVLRAKGFLSVGHDEYYTLEMYENLRAAVDSGVSLAFLSGNTCCGRIELLPNAAGVPNRVMRRLDRFGKRNKDAEIKNFPERRDLPWQTPSESNLIGARSVPPMVGCADWICVKPNHWLFEGTGMEMGEPIPNLVGWEWHGEPATIPGLEVVATGQTSSPRGSGTYTSTIYPGPRGNVVFNASTCWWGDGLSEPPGYVRPRVLQTSPPGPDRRVQTITRNLLDRMLKPPAGA